MEDQPLDDVLQHMVSQLTAAEKVQLMEQLVAEDALTPNENLLRLPLTALPELRKLRGQYAYELNLAQAELLNSPEFPRYCELQVIRPTLIGRLEVVDYFISLASENLLTHPTEGN